MLAEDTTISSSLDLPPRLTDQEFFHLLVEEPTTGDLQLSEPWQCLQGLQSLDCQGESVEGEELEVGCPRELAQPPIGHLAAVEVEGANLGNDFNRPRLGPWTLVRLR